jgi:hypothetical protein
MVLWESKTNDGDNNNNKIYHIYSDKHSIDKSFKGLKPILPGPYQPCSLRPLDQEKEKLKKKKKKKKERRQNRRKEERIVPV